MKLLEAWKVTKCGVHEDVETRIDKTKKEVVGRWWSGEFTTTGSEVLMMKKSAKKHNKVDNAIHMGNNLQYN